MSSKKQKSQKRGRGSMRASKGITAREIQLEDGTITRALFIPKAKRSEPKNDEAKIAAAETKRQRRAQKRIAEMG